MVLHRWIVLGATIALPGMARAQAQPPRPDSVQRGDTAQRLPAATIRDSVLNLPTTFLRRSRMRGTGKYLTSKDIEKLNPPHTPQLLARISGGDIRDIGNGNTVIVGARGTRMTMMGSVPNQLCVVGLAINDTRVPAGFDMKGIRPENIAAIEFYGGPSSIPLELSGLIQTDADCGLFVIWLKDSRRRP